MQLDRNEVHCDRRDYQQVMMQVRSQLKLVFSGFQNEVQAPLQLHGCYRCDPEAGDLKVRGRFVGDQLHLDFEIIRIPRKTRTSINVHSVFREFEFLNNSPFELQIDAERPNVCPAIWIRLKIAAAPLRAYSAPGAPLGRPIRIQIDPPDRFP